MSQNTNSTSPKRPSETGPAATARSFPNQGTNFRFGDRASSSRGSPVTMLAKKPSLLPEHAQGIAFSSSLQPSPVKQGLAHAKHLKDYSFSTGTYYSSDFESGKYFPTTQTNVYFPPHDDSPMKRPARAPALEVAAATEKTSNSSSHKRLKSMEKVANAFQDHAKITPDDIQRESVAIKDPSPSLFLDETEDEKAPRPLSLTNRSGSSANLAPSAFASTLHDLGPGSAKGFDEISQGLSDPFPLDSTEGGGSLLRDSGLQRHLETLPFEPLQDSAASLKTTQVYQALQPFLPLPELLTPIINVILLMEHSNEQAVFVQKACNIVVEVIQLLNPGENDKIVSGEIFERIVKTIGPSIDIAGYFAKARSGDHIDESAVQDVFFKEYDRVVCTPSFVPTNIQLALAYGAVHAKTARRMKLEDFVTTAATTFSSMTGNEKAALWNSTARLADQKSSAKRSRNQKK
ncbi:MAG: hypothetical protein SGILL_009499 [Bacillariaceae sp.]